MRDARVLEARVVDLRALIGLLPEHGIEFDALAWLHGSLPSILAILTDCLSLPDGETVDDLSASEAERLLSAWWELHADFFARALAALGMELSTPGQSETEQPSTNPSPRSASTAAKAPGTGDGVTSSQSLN